MSTEKLSKPVAWQETLSRAAKAFEALLETAGHFDKYVWADVPAQLRALTAPPAPAVPVVPEGWEPCSSEWIERNGPCSCGDAPRIAFGTTGNHYHPHMYYNPQPAPAVPEAIITAPIEAMRCGPTASYVLGWNACRAAMLAAAPEGVN